MVDTPTTTDEPEAEQDLGWAHRIGVFGEGIYDGGITAISGLGLAVDAVNHAPRLLNLLPYVDDVGPMTERPFLGSTMIRENLTGAHDAYKDLTLSNGAETFAPVDLTDHFLYAGGQVTGMAVTMQGTSAAFSAANGALTARAAAAAGLDASTSHIAITAATENNLGAMAARNLVNPAGNPTLLGHGVNLAEQGALAAGRYAATIPLRHPLLTAAGASYLDITQNGGELTSRFGKAAANYVAESFGFGTIFGNDDPNENPDGGFNWQDMLQDPTKLAGMTASLFALNSVLNNFVGGTLGMIASLAIVLVFNNLIGEKSHDVVGMVNNALNGNGQTQPEQRPGTQALPTPTGP
ncbi:MAG: hypothetical protein KKA05_00985 [Alphaproteobacteria bacterium]|nr:hypothetical protein [Alphaproteobacteria bacterium]